MKFNKVEINIFIAKMAAKLINWVLLLGLISGVFWIGYQYYLFIFVQYK